MTARGRAGSSRRFDGVYKKRFANALVDGTGFESEDILELVRLGDDAVYFRTHLEFYNAHLCELSGRATYRKAGVFVFDDQPQDGEGSACRLQIAVTETEVQLLDPDGSCRRYYCGARGGFDGEAFPRSARRPVRYMERLRASPEFREATGALNR